MKIEKFKQAPQNIRKIEDPDILSMHLSSYYNELEASSLPPTVSGLARALGVSRKELKELKLNPKLKPIMDDAFRRLEEILETLLITQKNTTGIQFSLKNSFDWEDKSTVKNEHVFKLSNILKKI